MIVFIFSLFLLSYQSDTLPCSDVPPILCRYFPYCMMKEGECVQDKCYASVKDCFNDSVCMLDKTSGVCTFGGRKVDGCTMMQGPHESFTKDCAYYGCDVFDIKSLEVSVCVRKPPSRAELCNLTNSVNCKFIYFCMEVNGECVEDTCAMVNSSGCNSLAGCTAIDVDNSDSLCVSDTRTPFDYCIGYTSLYGGLNNNDCKAKGCDGHRNMLFDEDHGTTVCVGGENNACNVLGTSLCKHNISCYVDEEEQKCKVDGCFGGVEITTAEIRTDCFEHCRKQSFSMDDETGEFCSTLDRVMDVCTYKGFDIDGECKEGCVKKLNELPREGEGEDEGEGEERPTITVCVSKPSRAISIPVHYSLVGLLLITFALIH